MFIKEFFAKESLSSDELHQALGRMQKQVESVGGRLTFLFKIDDEGWIARCKEFNGIVTGGETKNPSEEEVIRSLVDAIKTAFDIPVSKLEIKPEQKLPKIKIIREREFQLC